MLVAFDGSCKNNGKPECTSVGAAFALKGSTTLMDWAYELEGSTSQRGELQGLLSALQLIIKYEDRGESAWLISDSAYLTNSINKEWYINWQMKGWLTADGNAVKNQDLWRLVIDCLNEIKELDIELAMYHVKGHVLSVGPVTANNLYCEGSCGAAIYDYFCDNVKSEKYNKDKYKIALQKFKDINGLEPMDAVFKQMICVNSTVDTLATIKLQSIL